MASTSLVPLPRNLKEAIPATFTWLWGDKTADGERSLVVVFSLNVVFLIILIVILGGVLGYGKFGVAIYDIYMLYIHMYTNITIDI